MFYAEIGRMDFTMIVKSVSATYGDILCDGKLYLAIENLEKSYMKISQPSLEFFRDHYKIRISVNGASKRLLSKRVL